MSDFAFKPTNYLPKPDPSDKEAYAKWKAQQYGDASMSGKDKTTPYDEMLLNRHQQGLPLSKDARRRVR